MKMQHLVDSPSIVCISEIHGLQYEAALLYESSGAHKQEHLHQMLVLATRKPSENRLNREAPLVAECHIFQSSCDPCPRP